MAKVVFQVDGMSCTSCAAGIVNTLKNYGLSEVKGNYASGEISFNSQSTEDRIKAEQVISIMGYKVIHDDANEENSLIPPPYSLGYYRLIRYLLLTLPLTFLLMAHMIFPISFLSNPFLQLSLCTPVFLAGMRYFGSSAFKSLNVGVANMDLLITIGSSSAFFYSLSGILLFNGSSEIHNYLFFETSAGIIAFILLGKFIEQSATKKTGESLKQMAELMPSKALVLEELDGKENWVEIPSKKIKSGRIVWVKTGDKIPCDGKVILGVGSVNESFLTGESLPRNIKATESVFAGTILSNGNIRIKAEKSFSESSLQNILNLLKESQSNPPQIQRLGDKVSSWFVPLVIFISILTFVFGFFGFHLTLGKSIMNAVAVLVISCPCAMGLATPTAVMVLIGRAAKRGIMIKCADAIEKLSNCNIVVFDKTGTLTEGNLTVSKVEVLAGNRSEVLNVAKAISDASNHPYSKAISAFSEETSIEKNRISVTEKPGEGLSAIVNNKKYKLGSASFCELNVENDINPKIFLRDDNSLLASFTLSDNIREKSLETITFLKKNKLKVVLLSGDRESVCNNVATKLGIEHVYASKSPTEKYDVVKKLTSEGNVVMIGDGINDGAAMSAAMVGISHDNASGVAVSAAAIVITDKNFMKRITETIRLCDTGLVTIKQNLFWAFAYNIIAIPLAASGFLNPLIGTISMTFSDLVVIGNSLRLRKKSIS